LFGFRLASCRLPDFGSKVSQLNTGEQITRELFLDSHRCIAAIDDDFGSVHEAARIGRE
jgi:hypothetical protein